MEHYLDTILGDTKGYVAVAAKGDTWEERQFPWPQGRGRLLRWVEQRVDDANIFICPSVRKENRRVKGDGINLRWLWADIDWEKVNDKSTVMTRLKELGPALVHSGTGKNVHVYLQLSKAVTIEEHYRLNKGLREYLEADAKFPDNSLLRLPGTFNRKGRPVEVTWRRTTSKVWTPAQLLKIAIFKNVVVTDDSDEPGDGTYDRVKVDAFLLVPTIRRLVGVDVDQAYGKYGSRHAAVYAVTEALIKQGLNRDQIHTLMEEFAPGLDKEEEEHGYDMHRDIDRCIRRHPTLDEVLGEDQDEFEEATEEDLAAEDRNEFETAALKRVRDRDITARANQIIAQRQFIPPPEDSTRYLADVDNLPPRERRYLIDQIASVKHNITVTGQYKTGKTLFVCNLIRSLAEGQPFLDQYEVAPMEDTNIGFWSLEMTDDSLEDQYLMPQGFSYEGKHRLVMWHGRGYGLNIMEGIGRRWAINWLMYEDVSVWVIDSFARICRMSGVDENDNGQVLELLQTLDSIKKAAGVSEMFLIAHTGRSDIAKDRARGATVFDDWADARWLLSREGDIRFFQVEGRDVDLSPVSLKFDRDTKRLSVGTDRTSALTQASAQLIVSVVAENPGVNKTALTRLIKLRKIRGYTDYPAINELIKEAEELGFIKGVKIPGARGGRIEYRVVAEGEPGENGKASVRTIDFSGVKEYQGRRGN